MTADAPTRWAFYLAEACILTLVCLGGLLLARNAARRSRRAFPAVTPARVLGLGLCFLTVGSATGEIIGPQAILQYYVAGLAFGAGAGLWLLSFAPGFRAGDPVSGAEETG
jgi:hypothetical protein